MTASQVWLTMVEQTPGWFLWSSCPYTFTLGNKFVQRLGFTVLCTALWGSA